jgi:FtsZ-binding cell division protein ZapB
METNISPFQVIQKKHVYLIYKIPSGRSLSLNECWNDITKNKKGIAKYQILHHLFLLFPRSQTLHCYINVEKRPSITSEGSLLLFGVWKCQSYAIKSFDDFLDKLPPYHTSLEINWHGSQDLFCKYTTKGPIPMDGIGFGQKGIGLAPEESKSGLTGNKTSNMATSNCDDVSTVHSNRNSLFSGLSELSRPSSEVTDPERRFYEHKILDLEELRKKDQLMIEELKEERNQLKEEVQMVKAEREVDKQQIRDLQTQILDLKSSMRETIIQMLQESRMKEDYSKEQLADPVIVIPSDSQQTQEEKDGVSLESQILESSLMTLKPHCKVNDIVINEYLKKRIRQKCQKLSPIEVNNFQSKLHIENTYFFTQLNAQRDNLSTSSLMGKCTKPLVLIPINTLDNTHWSILCVLLERDSESSWWTCELLTLDSLSTENVSKEGLIYYRFLSNLLKERVSLRKSRSLRLQKQLPGSNDCGIYCLQYIDCALESYYDIAQFLQRVEMIQSGNKDNVREKIIQTIKAEI